MILAYCAFLLILCLPILIADGREAIRQASQDVTRLANPAPLPGEPDGDMAIIDVVFCNACTWHDGVWEPCVAHARGWIDSRHDFDQWAREMSQ